MNKSIFDRNFGHFTRVFVDINLLNELRYKVLFERKGFSFLLNWSMKTYQIFVTNAGSLVMIVPIVRNTQPIGRIP